jgi:hypothetical protein
MIGLRSEWDRSFAMYLAASRTDRIDDIKRQSPSLMLRSVAQSLILFFEPLVWLYGMGDDRKRMLR